MKWTLETTSIEDTKRGGFKAIVRLHAHTPIISGFNDCLNIWESQNSFEDEVSATEFAETTIQKAFRGLFRGL